MEPQDCSLQSYLENHLDATVRSVPAEELLKIHTTGTDLSDVEYLHIESHRPFVPKELAILITNYFILCEYNVEIRQREYDESTLRELVRLRERLGISPARGILTHYQSMIVKRDGMISFIVIGHNETFAEIKKLPPKPFKRGV